MTRTRRWSVTRCRSSGNLPTGGGTSPQREVGLDRGCHGTGPRGRGAAPLHPAGFDELMPKTLAAATATVDRLLRHAHVRQTSGESVRRP